MLSGRPKPARTVEARSSRRRSFNRCPVPQSHRARSLNSKLIAAVESAGVVKGARLPGATGCGAAVGVVVPCTPARMYAGGAARSAFKLPRNPTVSPRRRPASALISRASKPVASVIDAFSSV